MFLCACAAGAENQFTLIDYPGAGSSQAWGINSRGDIVGYYTAPTKTVTASCLTEAAIRRLITLARR